MEKDCIEAKKESSFEILPISDDDDILTISINSSNQNSVFESLNSSYFLNLMMDETEKEETTCNEIIQQNSSDDVENNEILLLSAFESPNNIQKKLLFSDEKIEDEDCIIICNAENSEVIEAEESAPSLELKVTEERVSDGLNRKREKRPKMKTLNDFPIRRESDISASERDYSTDFTDQGDSNKSVVSWNSKSYGECRFQCSVSPQEPERKNDSMTCCSLMKHGLRLCRVFWNNKCLQNVISGIKSSFHNLLNSIELEMNLMMGMTDPLKIFIVAETSDSLVIEECFYESFNGQVIVSKHLEVKDSNLPILPVGYNSALQAVQSKINKARQLYDFGENAVIISTTSFITEIYPQRWQLSTILCLEDPNLALNLHNFTSTVPVPNDYVLQAQKLTPDNYQFKELGLGVNLKQAMGCTDVEEILCGISHKVNLKSTANILAKMYRKYVDHYVL